MTSRPARLILLNGPPGIGKSTLARRYVNDRRLAFCLDIDGFRSLIGQWDADEEASGLLARDMALAMARTHLSGGHDVVVPQYVARPAFIDQLENAAGACGATFHEVFLLETKRTASARFDARADDPAAAAHHTDAVRMIGGGFDEMYDRLEELRASRRAAIAVCATGGVDVAYAALLAALGDGSAGRES
jgi:predicted kinase